MSTNTHFSNRTPRTFLRLVGEGMTDPGRVRTVNEDALLIRNDLALWAISDGMGGHSAGDFASRMVVEHLGTVRAWEAERPLLLDIVDRLEEANETLRSESGTRDGAMIGATVVCLAALGDRAVVVWAGDSRAYLLRRGTIRQLTNDHTAVQEMVDRSMLAPEEAEDHPHAHVLTRAIGAADEIEFGFATTVFEQGDRFVLCSDGLSRYASDEEIVKIASAAHPEAAGVELCALANARGGKDNVTVVIVACGK